MSKKENLENKENQETGLQVKGLSELQNSNNVNKQIFTNITSATKLFNLENECDFKLNDCIGEKIRVKEVLVKEINKMVDVKDENGNVVINEETGEVLQEDVRTIITILIDDNNKSYVTKSKMFAMRLRNYLGMFGFEKMENEGVDIIINTQSCKNSEHRALSFEIIEE